MMYVRLPIQFRFMAMVLEYNVWKYLMYLSGNELGASRTTVNWESHVSHVPQCEEGREGGWVQTLTISAA